jgi:hypothetical protein
MILGEHFCCRPGRKFAAPMRRNPVLHLKRPRRFNASGRPIEAADDRLREFDALFGGQFRRLFE